MGKKEDDEGKRDGAGGGWNEMIKSQIGEHQKNEEKGMMEEIGDVPGENEEKNKEMLWKRDNWEMKENNNDRGKVEKNPNLCEWCFTVWLA